MGDHLAKVESRRALHGYHVLGAFPDRVSAPTDTLFFCTDNSSHARALGQSDCARVIRAVSASEFGFFQMKKTLYVCTYAGVCMRVHECML